MVKFRVLKIKIKKIFKIFFKYLILFIIGGSSYIVVELCYRGYSHWTMFILGGLCFIIIGLLNEKLFKKNSLILQSLMGSGVITILEYITGLIVNIILKWNIWDYSNLLFNIHGQICLLFTGIWILVSMIAIIVDDYLRYWLFKEEKPNYNIF